MSKRPMRLKHVVKKKDKRRGKKGLGPAVWDCGRVGCSSPRAAQPGPALSPAGSGAGAARAQGEPCSHPMGMKTVPERHLPAAGRARLMRKDEQMG